MTPLLSKAPAGVFGDETGEARAWDGERWSEAPLDRALLPAEVRSARLQAQVDAFVRAGYRVERRGAADALLVRPARRGLRAVLASRRPADHRVRISIDGAGAVSFA